MIIQNKANSTNFGSINKFRVKPQDLEHFKNNINTKFKPGQNFIFNEHLLHEPAVTKILEQGSLATIKEDLSLKGFHFNDSFRLNSSEKHFNIYLVNEPKDIKKVFGKTTGLINQIKTYRNMVKNVNWAKEQIKPQNEEDKKALIALSLLKFTDEASEKFQAFAQKHGAQEFQYIAKKDGGMKLKPLTGKPADGIKFTMPVKDTETFFDTTFERINNYLTKKGKKATYIVENPRYDEFEEQFEKLEYGEWSAKNLQNKGFNVAIPVGESTDNAIDLYVFTSKDAKKKLDSQFAGIKGLLGFTADIRKANFVTKIFSKMVGGAHNDVHYSDAAKFLYQHELNKHQNNRFQKTIEKMNLKEIEFKAKDK